jgi:rSAM/selenodomain-associated transferase 2
MEHAISIVVPVRNDGVALARLLDVLRGFDGDRAEIIVVDGASIDDTIAIASRQADVVLSTAPGRGRQLRAGISHASADLIWMLHADTVVSIEAWNALCAAERRGAQWGRFDVALASGGSWYRVLETAMNVRSRITGICTGDQGIFVRRTLLERIGGMPDQPLMEDIELSKRLKRIARPHCISIRLGASARRWEQHGMWRTVVFMWLLRMRYFLGESPESLARRYYG